MPDKFFAGLSTPLKMKFPCLPVRAAETTGPKEGRPQADAGGAGPYLRPYANEQLNSRVGASLPEGNWQVKWRASLSRYSRPEYVLQSGDRIVVQSEGQWQLRDIEDGSEMARGNRGDSDVAFHPDFSSFCYMDADGYVVSHRMNGDVEHLCPTRLTMGCARLMIRRDRDAYFIYSLSYGPPPLGDGDFWAVEKVGLGDVSKTDVTKVLTDKKRLGLVLQKTPWLLCPAVHGSTSVLATNERLYSMDARLKIQRAVTGDFEPMAMSLDEEGLIYMAVRSVDGDSLWVLTPDGELLLSVFLPPGLEELRPPAIGFDHRVYLVSSGRVVCFDTDGSIKWEHETETDPGGFAVTSDNLLLLTEGPRILSFSAIGQRAVIAELEDETLRTPPVLTSKGELLAAGESVLYCLTAVGSQPERK